jgi:putative addiction module component (TIGR02574 family)
MSMTLDQLVAEAQQLPRDQVVELCDRLLVSASDQPDAEIDAAWRTETRRRVAEIESEQVIGIPGDEVMAEIRHIVGR